MNQITITEKLNGDYFTFYDNDLGTILSRFSGFEYATVITSIDDVAGPYGSTYVNSKHGRRLLTIEGDLVGDDIFTNRKLLLKALRQTGTMKLLKFTSYDGDLLQCEGEVTKYLDPYTHQIHNYLIEITAPDWRFYSQTIKSYDLGRTSISGGATIPASIPMAITQSTDPAVTVNNILVNDGNEVSDPVFTITGPGTNFTISNETSGLMFVLTASLIGGDSVVIDTKKGTVVKNGTDNLYPDITSGDFWSMLPGENTVEFLVDSGLSIATNLNTTFRSAYNGL